MDKYETRRLALVELIESIGAGGQTAVAYEIGITPNYVSRMLYPEGKKGKKRIGEDTVDKLNAAYPNWLKTQSKNTLSVTMPAINANISVANGDVIEVQGLDLEKTMPDNCNNFNFAFIHGLKISKRWAERKLNNISDFTKLAYLHNYGSSMQGTISDGDILLVDTGDTNFIDNAIYVIEIKNKYIIRRAHLRIDDSIEISTDNNPLKNCEILSDAIKYKTIGRVAWVWNGKGI